MYSDRGFRASEIGDVDVVKHAGVYHLFHLTLPNHDYIAHAVSDDGLHWQRVKNALFISDPKAWDDDMLWTMHVSPDPYHPGCWRMFYTGLCLREHGRIQRVGLAHSNDLYVWHKDTTETFPLEIPNHSYESSVDEGRHWVSFRDPFCFQENGQVYLLAAARVNHGPIIRRGCVSLAKEIAENTFEFSAPLFHPMRYDDVEVPNIVKLRNTYYLLGSIREDLKVHYWYSDKFEGPYRNFSDNVLLPQGNYAARVCWDEDRYLLWNFFYKGLKPKGEHFMAPPKELVVTDDGQLRPKSFEGFQSMISHSLDASKLLPLEQLFMSPHASSATKDSSCSPCWLASESSFEVFLLQGEYQNVILSGELSMEGQGKCGLVLRINDEGDGYYLSLDLFKGLAQLRAWRYNPDGGIEEAFHYQPLQAAYYIATQDPHSFCLLAYEQYIEFSLNGYVLLSLADDQFERGKLGFYVESARIRVTNLQLHVCHQAPTESYPTGMANY
jgi:beta-fructofuranosidase